MMPYAITILRFFKASLVNIMTALWYYVFDDIHNMVTKEDS